MTGFLNIVCKQNEAPLDEEGKVQKALQVVEAIYIDQDEMDTVVKASGVMSQEEMYNRIWKDYIVPKIEESNRTFDSNTYFEYLGEKISAQNLWSHVFKINDQCSTH